MFLGNCKKLASKTAVAIIAASIAVSCQSKLDVQSRSGSATSTDSIPPEAASSLVTVPTESIATTSVKLLWTAAKDDKTKDTDLLYEVRVSKSSDIDTVEKLEANSSIAVEYTSNLTSATISNLDPGTTYYFVVIVKDASGNKAIYKVTSASTAADTTAPTPGSSGTLTSSSLTYASVKLSWTAATDDVTSAALIGYEVRRSSSNNMSTVSEATTYGTIAQAYTTAITSATITGLTAQSTYYFTVIAKDSSGNKSVYATINVTTPIDTSVLWTGSKQIGNAALDGNPSGYAAQGGGIARDSANNIIVTGYTSGNFPGYTLMGTKDLFVAKYSAAGVQQWITQLGSAGVDSTGGAVVVDSNDNIYVSGWTNGGLSGNTLTGTRDAVLIKYNSSGVKQWVKQFGVATKDTYFSGMTIDSSDNIFACGSSTGAFESNTLTGFQDLILVKFNTSGVIQWSRELGVATKVTQPNSITLDSLDDIILAGRTTGGLDGNTYSGGWGDMFVTKYNSAGTKQWTSQLGGGAGKGASATGVITDSSDNVYISGYVNGNFDGVTLTGTTDLFLTKYNSAGAKQSTQMLGVAGGATYTYGMAKDGAGNFYVSTASSGALDGNPLIGTGDTFITKYNSTAVKQWTKQVGAPSAGTTPVTKGLAITSANEILITGFTSGSIDGNTRSAGNDAYIAKFDTSGTKTFVKQFGPSGKNTYLVGTAVDTQNNVLVAGYTTGSHDSNTLTGAADLLVMKYNNVGTRQWSKQLGVATGSVTTTSIATDSTDAVAVCGSTNLGLDGNTITGTTDFFLTRYDSSGVKQWTREMGAAGTQNPCYGLAIDSSNNIVLIGSTGAAFDGNALIGTTDFYLVKYSSTGVKAWSKQFGVAGVGTIPYAVAVDTNSNIYAVGYTLGNLDGVTKTGSSDAFIVKYDSAGTKQWTKLLGVAGASTMATAVKVDSSGNIFIAGHTWGALDGLTLTGANALFLAKYDSTGTKQWSRLVDSSSGTYTYAYGLAIDSSANIIVSGQSNGGVDGNALTGTRDQLIVKYNSAGTKQWTRQIGTTLKQITASGVAVDSLDGIFAVGYLPGSFDGNTQIGGTDGYIVKYDANGVKQ